MKTRILLAGILACATLVAGCSSTPSGERRERLVVQATTMTLIERANRPAEKAARVLEAVKQAQTLLLDNDTTVDRLRSALLERVAERELPPSEKLIALEVIATISDAVEQRLGGGVLSPDAIVSVNAVLGWIESAAVLYVQDPSTG